MGYGNYSYTAHQAIVALRTDQSRGEVFAQRSVHPLMNPLGVGMRESRDSAEHPLSLPIIFALDVTGSMGEIPERLARRELPGFMKALLELGIDDPQILFMAVGDAGCDHGPLQVGQFESTAEDIDRWLTWSWLEGGGGGNNHESYDLAMYFAARHTDTDSLKKRGRRGYFFLTGDENPYPLTSRATVKQIIGDTLDHDLPIEQVTEELTRAYHPFFLVPDIKRRRSCEATWGSLFGSHLIVMESPQDTCRVAAAVIALREGLVPDLSELAFRLERSALEPERIAAVVRAVTPYAGTLGCDGTPGPHLEAVMP